MEDEMLSHPGLRHLIEIAILPRACSCDIRPDGSMTIQILAPTTRDVELTVAGINLSTLSSSSAIVKLIAEIEEEANASYAACNKMPRQA